MKAVVVFNALLALAAASPLVPRQDIDFELVDAAPDPTPASIAIGPTAQSATYDLTAATESAGVPLIVDTPVEKRKLVGRTACSLQPAGAGPVPSPDTDSAFLAYASFASSASGAPTPPGYTNTFTNLQASVNAYGYMGYTTLNTYDTSQCAAQCSQMDSCYGFNIFFERDPSVEAGTGCMDPPSTTVIKCSFWGGYVAAENALNTGQWRSDFHVVIAGSNGYMTTESPAVEGFTVQSLGNNAINAPLDCNGNDTYMGSRMYTTSTFDPNLCAQTCASTNEFDIAHPPADGVPMICKFFVTYLLSKNGAPQGQYCAMYTQPWDLSYATNNGQWNGDDHYTVTYGFSYSNDASPGLPVCPSDIDYLQSVGGDFCTSYNEYSAPTATSTVFDTTYTTTVVVATAQETSTVVVHTTTTATITAAAYKRDVVAKRAIATPASISNWEAASISSACSQVATGTITTAATNTVTIPSTTTSSTTQLNLVSTTTAVTAIVTVPAVVNCPSGFTSGANVYSGASFTVSCSATMSGTTFATTNEPNLQNCLSWCNSWGAYCHAVIYDTRYYQNCMLYSAAGTLSSSSTGTVVVRA
ncbi:hypothetical protein VE01_02394 [Pseudogymnoascus verrucosus]|uniref:Apple domain-containing protein n=1 Tax=Pseudogymnoascus verrucosus TaxID=342668 RepID=A0A1B8GSX1_9PEZI|nr:uncharacterized protein VE01_02394 [Pseudogymnoascus verrucosus]OBT98900.1 hypothetical protein VE01_02394 [Pseudogymnoascus verrucosus]